MSSQYTAAIVGCGSISQAHVDGYDLVEEVELVAVADPVATARSRYAGDGVREYDTIEAMLEAAAPDLVSVCTWHGLHADLVVTAARAGVKGIICEKPMAIGSGDATRMIEACEASGTKLVVAHQRRFTAGWEKARQLMREGAIGKPVMATNTIFDGLANIGTHSIDGTRFVLGDPEPVWVMGAVERRSDRFERGTPIEDCCIGLVHFAGDAQLFIQSDLVREGASCSSFPVYGTDGTIQVDTAGVRLLNNASGGWTDIDIGVPPDEVRDIGGPTNAAQVREFLAWIEGGPEHRGAGRNARFTVDIMMALYESARRRQVVHLPLAEQGYPLEKMIASGELPVTEPGTYDIRGFHSWEGVDDGEYEKLRQAGLSHGEIMRKLHETA